MKLLHIFYFISFLSFLSEASVPIMKTITVDIKGNADYQKIQDAVNSVPRGNNRWTKIHIKSGNYSEQVNVPKDKGFLVFEGDGASQTCIQWGAFVASPESVDNDGNKLVDSSSFLVSASNVVFKGIAFKNTYNRDSPARAVAIMIQGDMIAFYNCSFIGIQDTVCDLTGRHYFKDCYIEGAVDFIFGNAQSLYETCILSTVPSKAIAGWVTAHGRWNRSDSTGFVFKNCKLIGSAKTYLGRAWGSRSRVIFYETDMSDIVVPQGWDYWSDKAYGEHTIYVEANCYGKGSNTSNRVKWEKQLSYRHLMQFVSISFVDDGWLSQQGW